MKDICEICDKPASKEFQSQTLTYYRSKVSSQYYFCSKECQRFFNNNKKCKYCSYYDDLVKTEEGFSVCTNKEFWKFSCFEKYQIEKQCNKDHDISYDTDDYEKMEKQILRRKLEGSHIWMLFLSSEIRRYRYMGYNNDDNLEHAISELISEAISADPEANVEEIRKNKSYFCDTTTIYLFTSEEQDKFIDPQLEPF
jgi:hypothetical protein